MKRTIVVTGTDTDVGKTIFAAGLAAALGATYWKPVQAGLEDGTDSERVRALGAPTILPETYRLATPCSPHRAAEIDGVEIDPDRLSLPDVDGPLVVEGAGGALVPLRLGYLYADLFSHWDAPVAIVARTSLGTINHSLMTIEALRSRGVPILGIAFNGEPNEDSEAIICMMGGVRHLGRLPRVNPLTAPMLAAAFIANFRPEDFGAKAFR